MPCLYQVRGNAWQRLELLAEIDANEVLRYQGDILLGVKRLG